MSVNKISSFLSFSSSWYTNSTVAVGFSVVSLALYIYMSTSMCYLIPQLVYINLLYVLVWQPLYTITVSKVHDICHLGLTGWCSWRNSSDKHTQPSFFFALDFHNILTIFLQIYSFLPRPTTKLVENKSKSVESSYFILKRNLCLHLFAFVICSHLLRICTCRYITFMSLGQYFTYMYMC